jgi:hypothetical protein
LDSSVTFCCHLKIAWLHPWFSLLKVAYFSVTAGIGDVAGVVEAGALVVDAGAGGVVVAGGVVAAGAVGAAVVGADDSEQLLTTIVPINSRASNRNKNLPFMVTLL